jgi:hypothetical protein
VLIEERKREKLKNLTKEDYDEIIALSKPVRPETVYSDANNIPLG